MPDAPHPTVRPGSAPLVPELTLLLAPAQVDLWELAGGGYRSDEPPPFWAFAWAGGQALARHLLDHPELVAGRRVLDVAAGSGLAGIAAAKAGASTVRAVDNDPAAVTAAAANARANGVLLDAACADPLDADLAAASAAAGDRGPADVVLAGDVFYSAAMAHRMLRFLRRAAADGARVLVGDADRGFLPERRFRRRARYDVPVPPALEGVAQRPASVWELIG